MSGPTNVDIPEEEWENEQQEDEGPELPEPDDDWDSIVIKTPQFEHQQQIYDAHKDAPFYALFWEMGLGKTKLIIDVASYLHSTGKIKALVIVAPNSVYQNWISEELPKHLGCESIAMDYPKGSSERTRIKKLIFLDPEFKPDRLRVISISYDSVATDHGAEYIRKVMLLYDALLVADESTAIKSHTAIRTRTMKKLRNAAKYRWIATGTPVAQSPFDIHSQIAFLSEDFWGEFGVKTLNAFKNEFGEFQMRRVAGGRQFPELKAYRRLDILQKIIEPISSRLLKEDSTVKLPPKSYMIRRFELTPRQRKLYNEVKYEYEAELDGGLYLEAPMAIVRLARLQQITSGFVTAEARQTVCVDCAAATDAGPCPGCYLVICQTCAEREGERCCDRVAYQDDEIRPIKIERRVVDVVSMEDNPRLDVLVDILNEAVHKVIVWCRFTRDVDNICHTLGTRALRYDGRVGAREREEVLRRFRDPADSAQVLVANTHAISQGVTLTIAKTMVYYSNSFSLEKRLQSEDRFHRIGQDQSVQIIDIVAEGSVDEHVVKSLREKFDIQRLVTGDKFRAWIGDQ